MSIHINAEQEEVIGQALRAGLVGTTDEAIEVGVGAIRLQLKERRSTASPSNRNLVELFANSPFAGLDIDFKRDRDRGREVPL